MNSDDMAIDIELKTFDIISRLKISAWEDFYHVLDQATRQECALVTLNKRKYIGNFSLLIDAKGDLEDEKRIEEQAQKEFEKVNQQFRERYERIRQLPAHPVLPKVLAVHHDKASGRNYAVLEYRAGSPFLQATAGLTPLQSLGLVKTLLSGLQHMHDEGLLHRRIKSENIFVHFEGIKPTARFTSWGLAVPADKAQNDRSGARHYTAPEILFNGQATEQADLWSVGSLLYHALTGRPPHPQRAAAENLHELTNIARDETMPSALRTYPFFQNLPPEVEEELKVDTLQELLEGLLEPDPEQRKFRKAHAAVRFIEENWPRLAQGAPATEKSVTLST